MTGPHGPAPVLCDEEADRRLAETGFATVPLLSPAEVDDLRRRYLELAPGDDDGLTIDFMRTDRTVVREVADLLAPMWARHLPGLFVDHRPVISTFVVKHPGPDSAMVLHHEPTFVDSERPTYNVWIPLVDVSEDPPNGALQLVLGSQHLPFGLVGFNTPVTFLPFESDLRAHTVTLSVAAGSAVIYDSRMLHVSAPNLTDHVRPAIAAAVAPRSEALVHVVATGRRRRQVHRVDEAFFLDAHPFEASALAGAAYPVTREVVEGWSLSPDAVGAVLGVDQPPVAAPIIPGDVLGGDDRGVLVRLATATGAHPPAAADVVTGADALGGELTMIPGLAVTSVAGSVAAVPMRRAGGPSSAVLPGGLAPWLPPARRALVVAMDEGSRLALAVTAGPSFVVGVFECPAVNAGMRSGDRVASFDLGEEVVVAGPDPLTIWNDGPGPVWLVVSPRRRVRRRGG